MFFKKFMELGIRRVDEGEVKALEEALVKDTSLVGGNEDLREMGNTMLQVLRMEGVPSYSQIKEAGITHEYLFSDGNKVEKKPSTKPRYYQIETLAACNAACSFCPYETMSRKGSKMSDAMIEGFLSEITSRPQEDNFSLCTHKVSEPLLDDRTVSIIRRLLSQHKNARFGLTTNLNMMPKDFLNEIKRVVIDHGPRISISVSINEAEKKKYEETMKLDYNKTVENLRKLASAAPELYKLGLQPITVTRTSTNGPDDLAFLRLMKSEYSEFNAELFKLNSWVEKGNNSIHDYTQKIYGDRSCKEWSRVSINADGNASLCCMDAESIKTIAGTGQRSLQQIYQDKMHQFVPKSLRRRDSVNPCKGCNYPSF